MGVDNDVVFPPDPSVRGAAGLCVDESSMIHGV